MAAHTETRASHLDAMAVGMGKVMHMEDFLKEFPGSRTAILSYVKLDTDEAISVAETLKIHANIQERSGRDFWPQLALETRTLDLYEFRQALLRSGSRVDNSVRTLAHAIALYRDHHKWFFIRPFSEMNDATEGNPWEFGSRQHRNTPQEFAAAWKRLRDVFDEEGATNAIFVFSPLAAYRVHREPEVLQTLNLIPTGYIDAFGLNVYSRPMTAYGGNSAAPIPFAELAAPWLKVLAASKHRGIPLAVPEMGVSNQASDAQRKSWLHQAFVFAKAHDFVMLTYFNYPHPYWTVEDNTLAGETLREVMSGNIPTRKPNKHNNEGS